MSDYPTDDQLAAIRSHDRYGHEGYTEWMEYVRSVYHWPERQVYGPQRIDVDDQDEHDLWRISTGGWSGNEEIMYAMQANYICWSQCWYQHTRGGHYEFRVRVT